MVKTASKTAKSETLTIRLDPKTRFILEYVSRLKGQTITTVVERAIVNDAAQQPRQGHDLGNVLPWQHLWDVSDGARALNVAGRPEFFPTYEEARRLSFCQEHWPFFYLDAKKESYCYPFVNILWPRIDEFIQIHDLIKSGGEYWAAGAAMQKVLAAAVIEPPQWPIEKKENNDSTIRSESKSSDDDSRQ